MGLNLEKYEILNFLKKGPNSANFKFWVVDKVWKVFFLKFGRNRRKASNFVGFWTCLKIQVIASTLENWWIQEVLVKSVTLHLAWVKFTKKHRTNSNSRPFYFLITYGVCKKRKYCIIVWVKKKILSFWWMFMFFYVLEHKTSKKWISVFRSVCLSVWLSGCTRTWILTVSTITFEKLADSNKIWWVSSVYEMQVWYWNFMLKSWCWSSSWSWVWKKFAD